MRRVLVLCCLIATSASCRSCGSDKYGQAAAATGVVAATAGVYRATLGECWADCPLGTECDEASGECVPLPCDGKCPADLECAIVDGKETCVHRTPESAGDAASDPCQQLCFAHEDCVVRDGVADCVPNEQKRRQKAVEPYRWLMPGPPYPVEPPGAGD